MAYKNKTYPPLNSLKYIREKLNCTHYIKDNSPCVPSKK